MLPALVARRWQINALEAFENSQNRGIIEAATGGGKTIFALMCFQQLRKARKVDRLLVVVPTIALADQWMVSFTEDLGLRDEETLQIDSKTQASELAIANVVVINTARGLNLTVEVSARTFLVVDECHRAGSKENSRSISGMWAATLGLSATPERQYDDGSSRFLIPSLGPKIFSYSVAEALRDGVLTPFDLINIEVPLLEEERDQIQRISKQIGIALSRGDDEERLQSLLRRRARLYNGAEYRVPVTVRLLSDYRGSRSIVFHESISAATRIYGSLREQNHSASLYHSRLAPSVRRNNLKMFRKGVVDVLVTCRALDEGANIPETQLAIVAAATASQRQRIQRLGRVLRPAQGKKSAVVFTLFATDVERRRLEEEQGRLHEIVSVSWRTIQSV
jgi:superfamily II DNA or RNA helicase